MRQEAALPSLGKNKEGRKKKSYPGDAGDLIVNV